MNQLQFSELVIKTLELASKCEPLGLNHDQWIVISILNNDQCFIMIIFNNGFTIHVAVTAMNLHKYHSDRCFFLMINIFQCGLNYPLLPAWPWFPVVSPGGFPVRPRRLVDLQVLPRRPGAAHRVASTASPAEEADRGAEDGRI